MPNVALLLTPAMQVHDSMMQAPVDKREFCPRCCGKFTAEEFENHDHLTCTPIAEVVGITIAENEPVLCPGGCGTIHAFDVSLHRRLGCAAAAAAGFGPFTTGNELSMAD